MSQTEKDKSISKKSKGTQRKSFVDLSDDAYEELNDSDFIKAQRELLNQEKSIYLEQAASLKAEADYLAQEAEPGDVQFDEESGEGGTTTIDRERDLALAASALAAVEEIDDAFRKIEHGIYGRCENCHVEIPRVRLRALPFARLCVQCKSGGLSRR